MANMLCKLVCVTLASACYRVRFPSTAIALSSEGKAVRLQAFSTQKQFAREMQESCHTPSLVLSRVGRHLSQENDTDGKMSSLVLVRLAKMMISRSNELFYSDRSDIKRHDFATSLNSIMDLDDETSSNDALSILRKVCDILAKAIVSGGEYHIASQHDMNVEGFKAAGILSRLCFPPGSKGFRESNASVFSALGEAFRNVHPETLNEHHLSGLKWAYDCLSLADDGEEKAERSDSFNIPTHILSAYQGLELPFRVFPGFFSLESGDIGLTVSNIRSQVSFRTEEIRTTATERIVKERRQTAWEGEDYVPGFAYSGKIMETCALSPVVKRVRDQLHRETGTLYDCCLLNSYPDGDSGMRYHIDPDQGKLWGYETAVVSVGAARRFAFRELDMNRRKQPHNFVVMDGDVVEMFGDCQSRFQHTVKTAEDKHERAERCSLVFKKYLHD